MSSTQAAGPSLPGGIPRGPVAWAVAILLVGCLAAPAASQAQVQVRQVQMVQVVGQDSSNGGEDEVEAVLLPESPNLDRFLHRTQDFLERGDHQAAVRTLQELIEGRAGGEEGLDPERDSVLRAVHPRGEHVFVPVLAFCHELLARLPEEALALYRARHDGEARRLLEQAAAARDLEGIEEVVDRFFASSVADDALDLAGDLLMARGRYRQALAAWNTLLDLYPPDTDRPLPYVLAKMAWCHARLGEGRRVEETLDRLEDSFPRAVVRVAGELLSVEDLRRHPLFLADAPTAPPGATALEGRDTGEVPPVPRHRLHWSHRFEEVDHHEPPRSVQGAMTFFRSGGRTLIPAPSSGPGASVVLLDGRLLAKEHDRTLLLDLTSGALLWRGEGEASEPRLARNQISSRNPHFDFAGMRVHSDGRRIYATEGNRPGRPTQSGISFRNAVAAYDLATGAPLWRTDEGDLRGHLCLAPPLAYAGRLFLPVMADGWFTLYCLDPETGSVLWKLPVHGGGTRFARPPASPLVAGEGTVFFLTHAGAVAAVDALRGRLRWLRRYEGREVLDPRRARLARTRRMQSTPQTVPIDGFAPSMPILEGGRLVVAPSDGQWLLALDAATGELLWRNPREGPRRFSYVVGHNGSHLFLAGEFLQCIELASGRRLWERKVDFEYAGRGAVTRDHVYLPTAEGVARFPADGSHDAEHHALWAAPGTPSLPPPPYDLWIHRHHLILASVGGIAVFSDFDHWVEALAGHERHPDLLRSDPLEVAAVMAMGGRLEEALALHRVLLMEGVLMTEGVLLTEGGPPTDVDARGLRRRTALLAGERALELAREGRPEEAEALLQEMLALCGREPENRFFLMLKRVEVRRAAGDAAGARSAREELYDLMDRL